MVEGTCILLYEIIMKTDCAIYGWMEDLVGGFVWCWMKWHWITVLKIYILCGVCVWMPRRKTCVGIGQIYR